MPAYPGQPAGVYHYVYCGRWVTPVELAAIVSLVASPFFPGAVVITGYFTNRFKGLLRSRPDEGDFMNDPGGLSDSAPDPDEFDPPDPGGQMN